MVNLSGHRINIAGSLYFLFGFNFVDGPTRVCIRVLFFGPCMLMTDPNIPVRKCVRRLVSLYNVVYIPRYTA